MLFGFCHTQLQIWLSKSNSINNANPRLHYCGLCRAVSCRCRRDARSAAGTGAEVSWTCSVFSPPGHPRLAISEIGGRLTVRSCIRSLHRAYPLHGAHHFRESFWATPGGNVSISERWWTFRFLDCVLYKRICGIGMIIFDVIRECKAPSLAISS